MYPGKRKKNVEEAKKKNPLRRNGTDRREMKSVGGVEGVGGKGRNLRETLVRSHEGRMEWQPVGLR